MLKKKFKLIYLILKSESCYILPCKYIQVSLPATEKESMHFKQKRSNTEYKSKIAGIKHQWNEEKESGTTVGN